MYKTRDSPRSRRWQERLGEQMQRFSIEIKTEEISRKPGIIPVFLFQAAGIKGVLWKKRLQWRNFQS